MKKNAIRIAVVAAFVGLLALIIPLVTITSNKKTYTVDVSEFNNIIVVDGAPVLSSLSIVENRGRKSRVISITDDMVVSCDDTSTVGEKELVLKYNNQLLTVKFTVKCKVDFVADNKIVNTQYVMDLEEIEFPQGPEKEGCQFVKWHSDNVEVGTNLVYNAVYTVSSSVMPKLSEEYSSTYGKTLESITLPSNSNGYWKFVSETSTPVGNAGKNTFDVEFVPSNSSLIQPAKDVVTINVDKQKVSINVIDDTFTFDGTEKTPIYSTKLADLKVNCVVNNGPAISAGEYTYKLEIDEQNYKGTYYGTLNIEKVYAKIKIADANIDYTTAIPDSFDYVVLDKDGNELAENLVALLGVTTSIPTITDADKVYTITANVNDLENFEVEIENGDLTFNKVEWELDENVKILKYSNEIVYGGVLKNIEFAEYVHGKWYWNEPEFKVLQTGELKTMATFIPNNDNYLKVEREVTLKIVKKKIAIVSEIRDNTYTYNANPHTISYRLLEVESVDDPLTIKVDGVITETDANENGYVTKLVINDERYQGSKDATLVINKGSNSDFANAVVSKEIVYNNQLKLGDVQFVNNCYAWAYPNIQLYTIGKQSFTVKYTPTDTKNYKIEEELVEIEVKRAETLLNVKDCENDLITYTYSASGYDFVERVGANHKESTIVFDYKLNGQTVDCLDCAGTYSVTISLPQTTHYKAQTKTITVVINKVENTQAVKTSVLATYGDLVNKYLPKNDDFGKWSWVDATDTTTVGDATVDVLTPNEEKTRAFNLVYTPTKAYEQNYNSRNLTVNFTVKQKEVKVPVIANKIYNGKNQKPTESELDYNQTLYTIDENNGGTNVNENGYDVKLTLRDSKNYVWSGENAGKTQITVTYNIISSETNGWIYTPTMSKTWKYSETPSVVAGSVYGEYKILFKLKDSTNEFAKFELNKAKTYNVGKYTAKFVVEQDEYKNYNGLETAEFDFEITYFEVDVPAVTNSGVTYTGSNIKARIATSDYYTISNDTYKNAGKYKVTLTLNNDNYKWKNDETRVATKQLDFEIKQIENKQVVATEVVATYGDLINKYLPKNDGYGVWKWMFGGEYVTETTTVGNATVDVLNPDKVETRTFKLVYNPTSEFEQNYAGRTINVKFVVKQAIVEVPTIKNKVFNNAMQYPTQDELDYDQTYYTIVQNDGGKEVEPEGYFVKLKLKDVKNYVWSGDCAGQEEITISYKINSSSTNDWINNPTISRSWEYGKKAVVNASSVYGTYKVLYKAADDEGDYVNVFEVEKSNTYNVGKYKAIFVVKNENGFENFNELVSEEFEFEVRYHEVIVPTATNSGVTYNGNEYVAAIATNADYTIESKKFVNAGTYYVAVTLTNDNYIWKNDETRVATKQIPFVINKVENTQVVKTEVEATYGELLNKYLPQNNKFGAWSWVIADVEDTSSTTVGEATVNVATNQIGVRVFKLAYTPFDEYKQNYAARTLNIEFVVKQKLVKVPVIANKVFNNQNQKPTESELDYNQTLYTIKENNGGTNVTEDGYAVKLALRDSKNYVWSGEDAGKTEITIRYYIISSSENDWIIQPALSNSWVYGSKPEVLNASSLYGSYKVMFKLKGSSAEYAEFDLNKADKYDQGTYVAVFVVDNEGGFENFNELRSEEITFVIKYFEVSVPEVLNSGVTYNGTEQTANIETSDNYVISNNKYTNAGEHDVTLTLTNKNYIWKNDTVRTDVKKVKFVINQIENKQDVATEVVATYGDLLNSYLPTNDEFGVWSWVGADDTTTVGDATVNVLTPNQAKTRTFKLVYTPTDEYKVNYATRNVDVVFTVEQKVVDVPTIDNKVFNGEVQYPTEDELDYKQTYYTIKENNGGEDVSKDGYSVKLSLKDSKNYTWNGSDAGKTEITITYKILSVTDNSWIKLPTISASWEYGKTPEVLNASSTFGEYKVLFKLDDATSEYTEFDVEKANTYNAGKYVAKFVVEEDENGNYNGLESDEIKFEIKHIEVKVPTVTNSGKVTYNGETQVANIEENSLYNVSNNKYVNAGTHKVKLTLTSVNHKWENDQERVAEKELDFVINQVENTQNVATTQIATYGDLLNSYLPTNDEFGVWTWVGADDTTTVGEATVNVATPNEAKTRTFKLVYAPTEEYKVNYASRSVDVVFTVNQQKVAIPTIANVKFNNDNQSPLPTEIDENSSLYSIEQNVSAKHAGKYTVILKLKNSKNYCWDDSALISNIGYLGEDVSFVYIYYVIGTTTNTWETAPSISEEWTYSQTAVVAGKAEFGDYRIEFKVKGAQDSTYTTFEVDKSNTYNVGTYTARFVVPASYSETNSELLNYKEMISKEFDFEIKYFEVPIPSVSNSGSFAYTGEALSADVEESDYYSASNTEHVNAGTNKVTLTLNNPNYKWKDAETNEATTTVDFVINKVENTQAVAVEVTATYGDLLNSYLPEDDEFGKWSWVGADATTTVGTATKNVITNVSNTRTFKLQYNPTAEYEQNYASRSVEVEFTVEQQEVSIPTIAKAKFNNDNQSPLPTEIDENSSLYSIEQNVSAKHVGTYDVKLKLKDSQNYCWKTSTLTSAVGYLCEDGETVNIYYEITTGENSFKEAVRISKEWTYSEKAEVSANSTYGTPYVEFKVKGAQDSTYTTFEVDKSNTYNVGTYTARFIVPASYSEKNSTLLNYAELKSDEIDFVIKHYEVTIPTVLNSGTLTYTGEKQTAEVAGSDYYSVSNAEHVNAGTNKVTLTLNSSNYKWEDVENTDATTTIDFVINKVENTQNVATDVEVTYGDLLNSYLPSNDEFGEWSWVDANSTTTVGNATVNIANGTSFKRSFSLQYNPTAEYEQNYASRSVEVKFTVKQKPVTVPTIKNATFNGDNQSPTKEEIDDQSSIYEIKQNISESQAGTYEVVLQLRDADNYCWDSNNLSPNAGYLSEDISIVNIYYTIGTATNIWETAPSISNEWVYSQTALVSGKAGFGDYRIEFKVKDALDSTYKTFEVSKSNTYGVGNYTARFVVPASYSSTNSELLNYNGLTSEEFDFEIKYLEIDKPAITNLTHTYSGAKNSATIESSSYYSITGNSRVNAGSQTITIALTNANCKWKNGARENLTYTLTVDPATNTWNSTPQNISITYGGSYTPSASAKFGSASVAYSSDGGKTYGTTKPTNAGSYNIKYTVPAMVVDGNTNYDEISYVVDLTIAKANITLGGYNLTDKPYYENSAVATLNSKLTATGVNGVNLKNAGTFTVDGSLVLKTTNPTTSQTYETISYNVTFTPNAATLANYNAPSAVSGSIYLNRVAYIGSTYYGSIENALAEVVNATSATTVMVIPNASGDVTIASNVTIGSKVTLALPYLSADDNTTHVVNSDGKATLCNSADGDVTNVGGDFTKQKLTNKVVVLSGVTITNNGTLTIAGELSCGSTTTGVCGNTARNFAEIELQNDAKIVSESGSTIKCYGYIDESVDNGSSNVILNNGSHLDIPFIVNDMCGGTFMSNCYSGAVKTAWYKLPSYGKKITPFRQFELRNIVGNLTINSGVTVVGHANVFGSSKVNYTTVNLIGSSTDCLINLADGAKLESNYDSLDRNNYSGANYTNNIWLYGKNNFIFKGGATSNALSMTLLGEAVETKEVPFPISWHQNISLANLDNQTGAIYIMNYGYKILPGGKLTVDDGVTLSIDSISVYEKDQFIDSSNTSAGYPVYAARYGFYQNGTSMSLDEGKLIVNGTLKINSAISGKVSSTKNGSKIMAGTSGTYAISYTTCEVKTFINENALKRYVSAVHTFNKPFVLVKADGSTTEGTSNKTYTYNGSIWS